MSATRSHPLLKRLTPGTWTALAWCAAVAYASVAPIRLPGEAHYIRAGKRLLELAPGDWLFLASAAVMTLTGSAFLGRRSIPALSLLLGGSVLMAVALNSREITFPEFLAVDVALCHITATRSRRTALAAVALVLGTLAGFAATRLLLGFPIGTSTELAVALTAVIALLVGNSIQQSHDHARTSRAQAITSERLRIARELHDMVAHSIGIIAIQAGAARLVIDTRPEAARDALAAIETAGRETLSGLRRMLGALREANTVPAPTTPAPGLADLGRLTATAAAAGVRVDVRWRGERCPLPAEIDLSAFRIIQEAVTNVVRHAGTGRCEVSIEQRDGELALEVVDSGRGGHGTAHPGYGLVGMRERVGLLHGDFTAGPRPEGGFRVAARVPLPAGI